MGTEYRELRPAEIPEAVDVFIDGVADLLRRNNLPPATLHRDELVPEFEHTLRNGIFRVASVDGRLACICSANVRDDIWFLAKFWTVPEQQARGVGKALLDQIWQEGVRRGARRFFVWSSIDWAAMALYMRLGMLPGTELFRFAGELRGRPREHLDVAPLTVEAAASIDRRVRGTGREIDHEFWLGQAGKRGWLILSAGRPAGYVYRHGDLVGPAGWLEDELALAILGFAAQQNSGPVRLIVPGVNHQAIRFALEQGLRLVGTGHILTTAPIGQMERYLPSGGEFF